MFWILQIILTITYQGVDVISIIKVPVASSLACKLEYENYKLNIVETNVLKHTAECYEYKEMVPKNRERKSLPIVAEEEVLA